MGCILGSFIGDSCGSYVEFITEHPTEEQLNESMEMPGGGPHGVGAGQITDDGELTMSLLWGLTSENP